MEAQKEVSLAVIETLDLATQRDLAEKIFTPEGVGILKAELARRSEGFVGDMETAKGRAEIISQSAKYSSDKALVNKLRLALVAEEKRRFKAIDASNKEFGDYCDECRISTRQPVTDWELIEAKRVAAEKLQIEKDVDEEFAYSLQELLVLKEEKAQREWEEAQEREAAEAEVRRAKAETDRIAREAKIKADAEAKAKSDAKEAAAKAERDKEAAVAKAKADAKATADKVAQDAKDAAARAEAQAKADADVAAKKAANARHRAHVKKSVESNLIMAVGCTPTMATQIFDAIVGGEITHVTVNF